MEEPEIRDGKRSQTFPGPGHEAGNNTGREFRAIRCCDTRPDRARSIPNE